MAAELVDNTGQIVQPRIDMHPREVVRKLIGAILDVLSADGVQWSAEIETTTANVDVVIWTKTISEVKPGTLLEVEFGLTIAVKAVSSATADLIWKWQARNSGGNWVDLHDAVTETNPGITYLERTRSGYYPPVANFNALPFDIRLILQCNELNEGKAKVKNSSYVAFIYSPS